MQILVLICVLIIVLIIYCFRNKLYLNPAKAPINIPDSINSFYNNDINVWITKSHSAKKEIIILSNGNSGNLYDWYKIVYPFYQKFLESRYTLVLYDYPGFGYSGGTASVKSAVDSLRDIILYFLTFGVNLSQITLWGISLGGGVSAEIATEFSVKKIILQSTFSSLKDMVYITTRLLFFLPDELNTCNNLKKIKRLGVTRIILLHSKNDDYIPYVQFLKNSKYANKSITTFGKHHNDFTLDNTVANLAF